MIGYIYLTTNLINGKKYIGSHLTKTGQLDTTYFGTGSIILKALDKYGEENFSCEILEEFDDELEMRKKEGEYIRKYNAVEDPNFYNLSNGIYEPLAEGTKRKISESLSANPSRAMAGKHHTEETKQKQSQSALGVSKSEEHKLHISQAKIGTTHEPWNEGKIWVHNEEIGTLIWPEELDDYISKGFVEGKREHNKKAYQKAYEGTLYVNNGLTAKKISESELDSYLNQGWKEGRVKRPPEKCQGISEGKRGKIGIRSPEGKLKFINPEDFDKYEALGFTKCVK